MTVEPFAVRFDDEPAVAGDLHIPQTPGDAAIVLTHGAGGDRHGLFLIKLADALAERGVTALRCDLPYRQKRSKGPPSPAGAASDREGLRRAADASRQRGAKQVWLGGSSYGGRQASMLVAEDAAVAEKLLLLSYPLHPPGKPERLRTEHFPRICTPTLFAHGSKDAFGTIEEVRTHLPSIPATTALEVFEGAAHGIIGAKSGEAKATAAAARVAGALLALQ